MSKIINIVYLGDKSTYFISKKLFYNPSIWSDYRALWCRVFTNFIREIDMGIGKTEAYKNLMDRSGSKDFKSLVFLLFQAEKYGSSINQVLSQKSKYMKFELHQMIERKIKKMALLTMFPLVFLILPAFVLLAGGPLIFSVGGNYLQL